MRKYIYCVLMLLVLAFPALAQEAPPPRKMPRVPVNREAVTERKPALPPSREIQGQATVIDSERLHMDDFDLRLFGIVPPQLSASFGPQARAALDELTASQITTCTVRDRDREGRFLASCHNAAGADLALELLRRGLAVAARGSITATDFAPSYIAAEQAAESQKLGLWSMAVPAAANIPVAAKPAPVAVANPAPPLPAEPPKPHVIEEKAPETAQAGPVKTVEAAAKPRTSSEFVKETVAVENINAEPGFLARYQLLVTGLVMLATALGMLGAIAVQRVLDRRTEMKAIAAALRGELMAARAVCLGRLKTSAETEDKNIAWPRIRSTLYQAYVGRIGALGAELARRVASIYGQASDYASYYDGSDDARAAAMPKRQALQTLIQHIDEVLPRLAIIEHTGSTTQTEAGFSGMAAVSADMPAASSSAPTANHPAANLPAATILPPAVRLWDKVRDMAQGQWSPKKPAAAGDPIAEYTALIEEEMKRFAVDEGEEETTSSAVPPARLHGTGG